MSRFKNKVCLVTGAASGIGRATAMSFAKEGAKVVVSDVSSKGIDVVETIKSLGGEAFYQHCDISDWHSVELLIEKVVEVYGKLDCAVNSAGIAGQVSQPIHSYPFADWHKQIAVNLTGSWYFLKASINQMLEQGSGSIVLVSSAAGLSGHSENSPYSASKHGIVGLTRTAALEYADKNIRINCVCPTAIETPMIMEGRRNLAQDPEALMAINNYQAMKRMGQPEEVASVNLWLCSHESSFITGCAMPVDGGALSK
ncbi:SDR family NAD(P)-dependent oxidoreductase [Confluentibacter flavum]|uniref:Short chain dehydrogenase n=1 Tax=Confluentibacter flavum TaxID=1909700 RepID=A0A2N3HHW6_9FLAO|nr:SDR family oxidoreductase [Confluentibacter flavum]PKQ44556.1 short chain dehydrogenase [Confluentibacter flavum]